MNSSSTKIEIAERIHHQAMTAVKNFKVCEVELLNALEEADKFRVFTSLNFSSLFKYATDGLGLSDDVAYVFINVARKSRQVPELKTAIASGEITVSKAKKITAVINPENKNHWLDAAKSCSKKELEKLVAAESPKLAVPEKASYVSGDRLQLQVGVSEKFMLKLRKLQDLLSRKKRRPVSLEETMDYSVDETLKKVDPVAKAKRQVARGKVSDLQLVPGPVESKIDRIRAQESTDKFNSSVRKPLAAAIKHRLNLKYEGRCGFIDANGKRCVESRFIEVHHIQPLSEGGTDDLENLEMLCSGHHKVRHRGH